ncbi:MAG: DUF1837 domain-containing protein [Acidobacteriia bacterium]|nr:DUF1837 domain-containing protein [Terriglobia bacterium]
MAKSRPGGLNHFVPQKRLVYTCDKPTVRSVYLSDVVNKAGDKRLCAFLADRLPSFYRSPSKLLAALTDDYFITAVRDTLSRLPSADTFQESHFAEVCSAIFAEDVLGLKRLYSKLSLLTSENANAFKMDLLLVDPDSDPLVFTFGEVKSSPKVATNGSSAAHDKGCFADLFRSFNNYDENDVHFDLAAAKDRVEELAPPLRDRVKAALEPYGKRDVSYAGFIVIDSSTSSDEETAVLATRKNKKVFDVDLLRVQTLPVAIEKSYGHLKAILEKCSL